MPARAGLESSFHLLKRRGVSVANGVNEAEMAAGPGPSEPAPASYEAAVAELDRLVAAMETGQMPLERLLASYRRGAQLLAFCRERLQAVDEQVRVLEDGQLRPWSPE
jgi:exodeoxyribonuclease VII small subunit